jgi:hypothetical protein
MGRIDDIRRSVASLVSGATPNGRGRGRGITDTVASLVQGGEPDPQGYAKSSTELYSGDYDVNRPDKELREYWMLYESNPLISHTIDNTANKVVEKGWYFECDNEETRKEMTEYANNVGIVSGNIDTNLSKLMYQLVITYEVLGTAIIEKVRDKSGDPSSLQQLQTQTMEINTKPDSSLIISPRDLEYDNIKTTEEGKAAAYVQFKDGIGIFENREERYFSRDEILRMTRASRPGEVFGSGRVERVYERALSLESKLRDNDDAIAMKAWPGILFEFVDEDDPWTKPEMEEFMQDFDGPRYGPGMMKAVSGNVNIKEFAGETANIESAVRTDVNFIISGMPGPKYTLGTFTGDLSNSEANVQERQFKKTILGLRSELEDLLTPYFREVADEYGLDGADTLELNVGKPGADVDPSRVSGNVIRYTSDVDDEQNDSPQQTTGDGTGNESPAVPDMDALTEFTAVPDDSDVHRHHLDTDDSESVAELADSRLVKRTEPAAELRSVVGDAFIDSRDTVVQKTAERFETLDEVDVDEFQNVAEKRIQRIIRQNTRRSDVESPMRDTVEATFDTLNQTNHRGEYSAIYNGHHEETVTQTIDSLRRDMQRVVDEIVQIATRQLAASKRADESPDRWGERVESELSDAKMNQRAQVIANMRLSKLVNQVKLHEYRLNETVVGVTLISSCSDSTTTLCERLSGCGSRDGALAYFDSGSGIGEQLEDYVSSQLLYSGFDPLPATPPYHYGCRTELMAVFDDADEDDDGDNS